MIKLVLDPSAVSAFAAAETVDVGDLIEQVVDEGNEFAVPLLCLAEAGHVAKNLEAFGRLRLLAGHPHVVIEPLEDDWELLADAGRVYGSVVAGVVATIARANRGAYVITTDPDTYEPLPTIGI